MLIMVGESMESKEQAPAFTPPSLGDTYDVSAILNKTVVVKDAQVVPGIYGNVLLLYVVGLDKPVRCSSKVLLKSADELISFIKKHGRARIKIVKVKRYYAFSTPD